MTFQRTGRLARPAVLLLTLLALSPQVQAQGVDCARLQQMIAASGGRGGGQIRRQSAEIARTQAMIRQAGCEGGFSFFGGGNPQCAGLTQRLQGLQAGMAQLQASGDGGGRADLVARFNASCRGGQPAAPPQPKGFFESLFGGGEERREPLPQAPQGPPLREGDGDDDGGDRVHGGSQAVCVRTCDGGFFPMGISARRGKESLTEMCQALCPGTETAVYTRNPDADIKTAASLDGKPYSELPNALKFEKHFDAACTCRQAGKSWAETLANAEQVLGATRKGDIVVTKEKSDELSRPKLDAKATAAALAKMQEAKVQSAPGAPATASPGDAAKLAGAAAEGEHSVRRVGPQP